MIATTEDRIKDDFLTWSGGTAPDSPFEIFTYVELARPLETDVTEAYLFLKQWMENEWQTGV